MIFLLLYMRLMYLSVFCCVRSQESVSLHWCSAIITCAQIKANIVVVNADPFRMRDMVGRKKYLLSLCFSFSFSLYNIVSFPAKYNERLDNYKRDGTSTRPSERCLFV